MTSVAAILAGQPTVDLRTFSPAEKALAIEDVVEIVQPFFKMNPYGLFVERFRPLGKILVTSSRVHHKSGHSIDLPADVSEDTMCMIIDHTPSQQEVYRMANRSRYTETNLLVTQEGNLILLRAKIEVEHDSIIDGTYYWVLRDEIDSGNRMAQKFFDSQPGRSPMQAIRVLHDFLERCLQEYAPLVAADAKLKRLRAALTD